jgi:hypothetical protein
MPAAGHRRQTLTMGQGARGSHRGAFVKNGGHGSPDPGSPLAAFVTTTHARRLGVTISGRCAIMLVP